MAQKEDISRSTILVLVFLAVIISVLGTWQVLDAVNDATRFSQNQPAQQFITGDTKDSGSGIVSLTVLEKPRDTNG